MTPTDIDLVQRSFVKLRPIQETTAQLLFLRLMERDPSLDNLFRCCDLKEQGGRVMASLGMAVGGLEDLDSLLPVLRDLAVRHVDYGVRPAHYVTFGEALLWTLEIALGEDFDAPARRAWTAFYELLSSAMMEAAIREVAQRRRSRRRCALGLQGLPRGFAGALPNAVAGE